MNKNNSSENCEMEGLMGEKKQPVSKVLNFRRPKNQRAIAQENFKENVQNSLRPQKQNIKKWRVVQEFGKILYFIICKQYNQWLLAHKKRFKRFSFNMHRKVL